ncbi:MAG TPA: protein kinase [Verrucomicrobiae bacterium]|jgi:serine/threonine protein kinase
MNANEKIEALFEQALKFKPEERAAFLAGACGADESLRRRAEELLQASAEKGGFLPTDPGNKKTIVLPITEQPGDRIGRYKILQQIGEGGCGVVYMAEQAEPVRRRVALKVIKLGMDTKSVIARFEAERQALAMMDHPNIAKVLDAGATETGRPFFVMELVRGVKITEYCDEAKLSTTERLKLFIQVCHAIQHAHQKGIIHRDLKPSNILVTINDGVPVPKVIDFGIAKATTGQQLTDKTLFTAYEQFIGTPAYMSPEQAVMTSLDIDTRSDIYALGVLLYELLTSKPPFDPKELLQSGFDEMRRTIREKEPERPSTRLSTMLDADLTTVAQRRRIDAPKLIHSLRGDLDWIVMKALEKDRTRRFETANAMAMDIQRYLSNEPVNARPPSNLYRFQKLVRRNKTAFAAVGAVVAALAIGFGLSLYLFIQERQALRRAQAAESEKAGLLRKAEAGLAAERELRERSQLGKIYAEAGQFLSQRKWDEAENVMRSVGPQQGSGPIYSVLGHIRAMQKRWDAALTNFTYTTEVLPSDPFAFFHLTALYLKTGDLDGYRRHCQRLQQKYGNTSDPNLAERTVKACLILPKSGVDMAVMEKLADVAVATDSAQVDFPFFQFAKGLMEFRRGHFQSAVDWERPVSERLVDPMRAVQASMVMAMAQHQLQQSDEARETLTRGIELAQRRVSAENGPVPDSGWHDWIFTHTLIHEAKALVEADSAKPGPNAK